jgi:predicted Zn-dependent peptidase
MTAQLSLAIKYGSNDDSDDKIGTAHFLEHMLVGGSQERIRLHHEIEKLGGASIFETSKECTFSMLDFFPERLPEAAKVLSGLLFNNRFEKDKLEHERKVILNEIVEASDDPWDKTGETLLKCLFKKHPAKNPIMGSKKTVRQTTLRDIEEAHENHYSPQNMILMVTGKFSDEVAASLLEDFLDRENSRSISRQKRTIEVGRPKKEAVIKKTGINQAYQCFGLRTPPAKDPDIPAIELINAILGMGESSRLFVELREKRPLTYDFDSVNVAGLDFGFFQIDCAVKAKSVKQTQNIIQEELQKLKNHPVPKDELVKSKNLLLSDVYRSVDCPHTLPRILADSELYFENENVLVHYVDRIRSLSEQNVTEVANKYFQESNYATVVTTPKNNNCK